MIYDDLLQCVCILSLNNFEPTLSAITFNYTKYPCAAPVVSSMVLPVKEVTLVDFNSAVHHLHQSHPIETAGSASNADMLEVVIVVDYRIPTRKFFKQDDMLAFHFIDLEEKHQSSLLSRQSTMSKERTSPYMKYVCCNYYITLLID